MQIKISNRLSDIAQVQTEFQAFWREQKLNETVLQKMCIVIDEVLTNIIKYSYEDSDIHHIEFSSIIEEDRLSLRFVDDGLVFNPLLKEYPGQPVDIDDRPIGGLGIHLMKSLADDIIYERRESKNIVHIIKFINS
jgi:anti-sigma regulatory factor (Ser/Thr protein kinase)